jgi:hypothetical protein
MDRRIISYMGNLYMDSFMIHIQEMIDKGFNEILFCVSENDIKYNSKILLQFVHYAKIKNMTPVATFWGYTAGEALHKDLSFGDWVYKVLNIGFKDIFIDEPKDERLYEALDISYVFAGDCRTHLCLSEDTFRATSDYDIKSINTSSLGLSNYFWINDADRIEKESFEKSSRLKELRPKDNFVFIQGFDIDPGSEWLPFLVRKSSLLAGIKNFGFWSFRCTEATGCKRPDNYKDIWKRINFK